MSNFIERMFSNHTLFGVAQFRKQCKYFYRKYEDGIVAILIAVVVIAIIVGVIVAIVVAIRQSISRNIAREATQYSYKVGQKAQCNVVVGFSEFLGAGVTWASCTITSVTPDHRYYMASWSNNNKLVTTKFSIQNIGIQ